VEFVSPKNHVLSRTFSLTESYSNNVAEYNALLIGPQLAQHMGVQNLEAYGDSKLIINQVKGECDVRHEDLIPFTMKPLSWPTHLMASTLAMCLASKIQRRML